MSETSPIRDEGRPEQPPAAGPGPGGQPRHLRARLEVVEHHRVRLGILGLATLVLGAWGAIVPYAGPAFGFTSNGSGSWAWTMQHALLYLVPGAAAMLAALAMLGLLSAGPFGALRRTTVWTAGLLTMACGAWFVVGPVAWPVVSTGSAFGPASALGNLANQIGYNLGPGVLLAIFGGLAAASESRWRRMGAVPVEPSRIQTTETTVRRTA